MTNYQVAQSEANTQVEIEPTVNPVQEPVIETGDQVIETPEQVTEPVVDQAEQRISKVEQRIRKLADEKNTYKDEVIELREQLLSMNEKPMVEPIAEDYAGDIDAFVDAKLEYKTAMAEKANKVAYTKQQKEQQAQASIEQNWQEKINSLSPEKQSGYFDKVASAQKEGKLRLPQEVLTDITNSPVGPEVVLELIDNPQVSQAVQSAKSVHEVQAIIRNVEQFYANQRYSLGNSTNNKPVQSTAQPVTNASPAMPSLGSSSGTVHTDPRKMNKKEFQAWYKANRK